MRSNVEECHQYSGGLSSVTFNLLRGGISSVRWRDIISVAWKDITSTVEGAN